MKSNVYTSVLFLVACAIAALLSVGNLIRKGKSRANFVFAALMADIACMLGLSARGYAAEGGMARAPTSVLTLLALCGVIIYLLFLSLARSRSERKRSHFSAFLIVVPAALADILVYGFRLNESGGYASRALIHCLYIGVGTAVLGLCLASSFHILKLYFPKAMTKAAWTILIISIGGSVALIIGSTGMVLGDMRLYAAMDYFISIMVVAAALLDYRYPDALGRFHEDAVKRRYARSLLAGLDVEALAAGMVDMMKRTSVYRDEGFTLDKLAERMGLSAHQVSELLNDRMGTNFSAFINSFRIEEAKELLVARRDMTMLAVAMEAGFGNKTSFNEAFKRRVRMTPRQFRGSHGETRQER